MKSTLRRSLAAAVLAVCAPLATAQAVKLAYIEGLSGPLGSVGELGENNLSFIVDRLNRRNAGKGPSFEIVSLDSKMSPQEALVQLKSAIDQGIRIVTQGNGSAVAGALIDAIDKHNKRNPDKKVLFLNFAAIDPSLTNEKCSYWHFAFDANSTIKMAALSDAIKADSSVKKVYLVNQDYSHGHTVAKLAKSYLAEKRPDIKIVGEDLHPIARVKDFAPYAAKIRAAGADTVITGNWGNDLTLLVRAATDSGLALNWYTYYAGAYGSSTAIGDSGINKVKVVIEWNPNVGNEPMEAFYNDYKKRYPAAKDEFYYYRMKVMMDMLSQAIVKTGSTDAEKLAAALEGMKFKGDVGEVTMRGQDHQLIQPLFVPTFNRKGLGGVKYDVEESGYGFGNPVRIGTTKATAPSTCKMKRPRD